MPLELGVQLEAVWARRKTPNCVTAHSAPALLNVMPSTDRLAGKPVLEECQVDPSSSERNNPAAPVPAQNLCGTAGSGTSLLTTSLTATVATGCQEAPPVVLRYTPSKPPTSKVFASLGSTPTDAASVPGSMSVHVCRPSALRSIDGPTT